MMFVPEGCGHLTERLGRLLLEDDRRDFGKMERMHHWQMGVFMIVCGGLLKIVEEAQAKLK